MESPGLGQVSLTLPVQNRMYQERSFPLWQLNLQVLGYGGLTLCTCTENHTSGALPYCLALKSPGPQADQPHTPCTE
jgi:hypothetical protein